MPLVKIQIATRRVSPRMLSIIRGYVQLATWRHAPSTQPAALRVWHNNLLSEVIVDQPCLLVSKCLYLLGRSAGSRVLVCLGFHLIRPSEQRIDNTPERGKAIITGSDVAHEGVLSGPGEDVIDPNSSAIERELTQIQEERERIKRLMDLDRREKELQEQLRG